MKKTIQKVTETKNWFFENTQKVDKSLARQRKREKTQINKIKRQLDKVAHAYNPGSLGG